MMICKIGDFLKDRILNTSPSPLPGSPYEKISVEILQMASAYHEDGFIFHRTGDRVNAFASFAYGLGWMDAGIYMGLIHITEVYMAPADFSSFYDEEISEMLSEKTSRYERMLERAINSIRLYPDKSSPAFDAGFTILTKTKIGLKIGSNNLENGKIWSALWHLSYGYGWLDAGIRAGLIEVTANRDLFTVDHTG